MSARQNQDQNASTHDTFVQLMEQSDGDVSAVALMPNPICSVNGKGALSFKSAKSDLREAADTSLPLTTGVDAAYLIRVLRLGEIARQQAPRIAFKAKGKILFLELADIVAVQAEGNYVWLRPNPYLLRECLSSMAEKLKPYGFIRIHRSVVVNSSAVEEIQPLPTGEYRLRVKGGKDYLVTRTYKDNLRDLAQLWVGSQRFAG